MPTGQFTEVKQNERFTPFVPASACVVRLPITAHQHGFRADFGMKTTPVWVETGAAQPCASPCHRERTEGPMSLTVKPNNPNGYPADPQDPELHPLVVLTLALSLGAAVGHLVGWQEGVAVFGAVISLCNRNRPGAAE